MVGEQTDRQLGWVRLERRTARVWKTPVSISFKAQEEIAPQMTPHVFEVKILLPIQGEYQTVKQVEVSKRKNSLQESWLVLISEQYK